MQKRLYFIFLPLKLKKLNNRHNCLFLPFFFVYLHKEITKNEIWTTKS